MQLKLVVGAILWVLHTSSAFANGQIPREQVPGSCNDFNKFLREKGVGIKNPDEPAVTREPRRAGVTRASYRVSRQPNYTLSGRATREGQICVNLVYFKSPIEMVQRQRILQWRPPQKPSESCIAHVQEWARIAMEHEERHFRQNLADYNEHISSWKPMAFEKCVTPPTTRREADTAILAETLPELQRAVDKFLDELAKQAARNAETFHATPEGGPTQPLDCRICN